MSWHSLSCTNIVTPPAFGTALALVTRLVGVLACVSTPAFAATVLRDGPLAGSIVFVVPAVGRRQSVLSGCMRRAEDRFGLVLGPGPHCVCFGAMAPVGWVADTLDPG